MKKVVMVLVLMMSAQSLFAADKALNKDQFKAPSPGSSPKSGGPVVGGLPVGTPAPAVKDAGIQGLQSDAELQAWQSAPERVPATPQGSDKFTCPRGYFCEAYMTRTPPSTCVKDSFLFSTHEGGYCSKSLDGMWYGGRDKAERVA